jgi:predicted Zn-dependent protease
MIRDYQAIACRWFPKGQQKIIPTYGKHHGAKLLVTVDYQSGEIYWEERDQYDAQVFLSFLEHLVEKYPNVNTVLILDNARIHHAKLIQPLLEQQKERL